MPRKPKLRETTHEVLVVANTEDNPTGYRITVLFKRPSILISDLIVIESPLFDDDGVKFRVCGDHDLRISTGDFNYLTTDKFLIALGLIQKHKSQLLEILKD